MVFAKKEIPPETGISFFLPYAASTVMPLHSAELYPGRFLSPLVVPLDSLFFGEGDILVPFKADVTIGGKSWNDYLLSHVVSEYLEHHRDIDEDGSEPWVME